MKLIYATDQHIKGRNPGSRLDDYPTASLKKMQELHDVCMSEQPDALVFGGDFYDTPRVSFSLIIQYARILRKIKRMGVPIYLVPGNHDLFGYSMDTIDQTAIGVLAESGLVKLLTRKRSYEISSRSTGGKGLAGPSVTIHGREYDKDIDMLPKNDYQINKKKTTFNLLFSHGMLLQKPFHPDVRHSLTSDVETDADLVLNGHYHDGMPLHEINGTIFGNPGSSGRDEICKRMPQYAIIKCSKKNGIKVKYVEYACAEPYADIFDFNAKVSAKQHERYLEAFEQTVMDAMTFESYDAKDVLFQLTAAGSVDQSIVDAAFDAIIAAEKVSGDAKIDGYIEKKDPLAVSEVELINFQSHVKTVVKFSEEGLNAITGPSDSGKTGIIRGMRWAFYNDPKGSDFIRHGESRATVIVRFNDGSSITRTRTHSDAGSYIVSDAAGTEKEFKGFGTNVPIDVANTHQMPKVELAPGIERPLNFSFQLDGHFMLSESPMVRAATIGRLTGVHNVDIAIKEKRKDLTNLTKDINFAERRVEELTMQIEGYNDLVDLESQINVATVYINGAIKMEAEIADIRQASQDILDTDEVVKRIKGELKAFEKVTEAEKRVLQAEAALKDLSELQDAATDLSKSNKEIKMYGAYLEKYNRIDEANTKVATLESAVKELDELQGMYSDLVEAEGAVSMYEGGMIHYDNVPKAEELVQNADALLAEIVELREIDKALEAYTSDIALLEKNIQHQVEREDLARTKMKKIFEAIGSKCPMCQQDIDEAHMEHIVDAV